MQYVAFFPVSFLCQVNTWMLSSVLDWADLDATKYVAQSQIQSSPAANACDIVWKQLMSVPSHVLQLRCHPVSCLPTSRLSCSQRGTCGFKCDPDLNRGQAVKGE